MPTDAAGWRPDAPSARPPGRRTRRLALSEKAAAIVLVALVFWATVLGGASEVTTATLFSGIYALYLLGLLATCAWARRDLSRLSGLGLQAGLFGLLMLAVLWPLTAFGPGGVHPVWSYVPGPGSLAIDRSALLLNAVQLLGLASLFVAARLIAVSQARGEWLLRAALAVLGAYVLVALGDHVALRRTPRLTATLLSPNSAATTFGAGLLLAVAALTNRFRRRPDLMNWRRGDPQAAAWLGLIGLLVVALLMTASRAGAVAALLGLGVLLIWNLFAQRRSLRGAPALLATVAVVLVAALVLRGADAVADRFSLTGRDVEIRSIIFAAHWEAFRASPWSGFGLGAFPTVNQLIATSGTLGQLYNIRAAHNLYLQWLEEGGIVGSVAMLALFLALLWPVLRGGLSDSSAGVWARASACGALIFLLHGLTDFALQAPAVAALATMILGAVGSMAGTRATPGREGMAAWLWPVRGLAAAGVVTATAAGIPLAAARLGADLSAWPTAPAEALAQSVEDGLSAPAADAATLRRLEALTARELSLRPASGAAWLRRAAVEARMGRDDALSTALERSYAVAPLQTSLFQRRTIFAYEHWDRISPVARELTAYAVKTEWRRDNRPSRYTAMANAVANPAGRVGLAFQIVALKLQQGVH